ncbi:hypothetical protein F5Y18DRAFT_400249 [Xylariaceae sp. FL1019]|nr:hypothetical protein F5Y18DRAFT_400249 [Xylariaceae sp. FL1019]
MAVDMSALSRMQIGAFFQANAPITQEECNEEAQRISGQPVSPTACQGGSSYTVDAGKVVVQFRKPNSALDMDMMEYIEQAYSGFAPRHRYCGLFHNLYVYTMSHMGGVSMYLARAHLQRNNCELMRNTIVDYARFFASAYNHRPEYMSKQTREQLLAQYTSKLEQLRDGLPSRFRATLDRLIPQLPSICNESWPLVPNHTDLLENNIHVDIDTGAITGICDWRDAQVGPFGMSLSGLETMLGIRVMNEDGWRYFPNHNELRELFWAAFYRDIGPMSEQQRQRIEVARLTGLFLENGWDMDDDGNLIPATEGLDLAYLGAVVLA